MVPVHSKAFFVCTQSCFNTCAFVFIQQYVLRHESFGDARSLSNKKVHGRVRSVVGLAPAQSDATDGKALHTTRSHSFLEMSFFPHQRRSKLIKPVACSGLRHYHGVHQKEKARKTAKHQKDSDVPTQPPSQNPPCAW